MTNTIIEFKDSTGETLAKLMTRSDGTVENIFPVLKAACDTVERLEQNQTTRLNWSYACAKLVGEFIANWRPNQCDGVQMLGRNEPNGIYKWVIQPYNNYTISKNPPLIEALLVGVSYHREPTIIVVCTLADLLTEYEKTKGDQQ